MSIRLEGREYKLDNNNNILMNYNKHAKGKLKLVRSYYKKALEIFAKNSFNNIEDSNIYGTAYVVDAFCGSGKYSNGMLGTPLILLEEFSKIIKKLPHLKERIRFVFNDIQPEKIESLKSYIKASNEFYALWDNIEFLQEDFVQLHSQVLKIQKKYPCNSTNSYLLDPYKYAIGIEKIKEIIDTQYHEILFIWMYHFVAGFIDSDNHKAKNHILKLLPNQNYTEYLEERSGSKNKDVDLLHRKIYNSIKDKFAKYISFFIIKNEYDQPWYSIWYLGNHIKGKIEFDRAKTEVGKHFSFYSPDLTEGASSYDFDRNEIIPREDIGYEQMKEKVIDYIPIVFLKSGKDKMSIKEIREKTIEFTLLNLNAIGSNERRMEFVKEIIPKAVDKFEMLIFGKHYKKNRKENIVIYINYPSNRITDIPDN